MAGNGSVELAALGARLKAASNGHVLRRELLRGIRTGAAPLIPAVRDAALEKLPHGGGLNEQVAGQRVSVRVSLAGRNTGVRLVTTALDTAQTDAGWVRHPVFAKSYSKATGRRVLSSHPDAWRGGAAARAATPWVTQQIPRAAGWWSQTLADKSPEVTPEVIRAMERVSDLIQGR